MLLYNLAPWRMIKSFKDLRFKSIIYIEFLLLFHYKHLNAFVFFQEMVYLDWLHLASTVDDNHELGSLPEFTLYIYRTTHLLNNIFAY